MAMARKPLVAGNWKMNGNPTLVREMGDALNKLDTDAMNVVVCPPSCFLPLFANTSFATAGQDVSANEEGAHTGDIAASMLRDLGCKYVIVGHSERRQDHGESSQLVANKAKRALSEGLVPIICVGEPLEVRESEKEQEYVEQQLLPVFETLSKQELSQCVVAYEPIWAIGTGKTASPEQAQQMHAFIRSKLAEQDSVIAEGTRLLYGGSVKPDNARELFAQKDIDGGLIGGASLKTDSFIAICQATQ
ncbi:triose-phosphate isomerase [Alteromonas sediminis]|uniref:Triosephosphate isomerase n=1 Tax=Alteromonas sediminis TaxID=2259342 RepID=A0A3N5Y432_9ALTE|nr:triose-phosphate isomerase [Alteromonas sediminis]RPJ68792.1 triose-phosphate isomerase [Alteromonas sediminis]